MAPHQMTQVEATSSSNLAFASAATVIPTMTRPSRLMVSEPARQWRTSVVQRLEDLVRLPVGWDGYAGVAVSFQNANFALRMLEAVCASDSQPPQIVPGSSGDLQIEWHTPRIDIELHVRGPNDVVAWRSIDGLEGGEIFLTNNFIAVANWIEELERAGAAAAAA